MSTYNRVVAADETASLAPTVRARLATEMADPTSDVGASLSGTFATVAQAKSNVPVATVTERLASLRDFGVGPVVLALASDSTANDAGDWFRRWMNLFTPVLPASQHVEYQDAWDDGTSTYTTTVDNAGLPSTGGTLIEDNFNRTETELAGSTASDGNVWNGYAGKWYSDGTHARANAATGSIAVDAGAVDASMTVDLQLVTTATGSDQRIDFNVGGPYWLSGNRVYGYLSISSVGNVSAGIYKYIGSNTAITATVTATGIDNDSATSQNATVTFGLADNVATMTILKDGGSLVTLSGSILADDYASLTQFAGLTTPAVAPGIAVDAVTIRTAEVPAAASGLTVINGAMSGTTLAYQQARIADMYSAGTIDALVIAGGHNYGTMTPADFVAALDNFIVAYKVVHPESLILICTENPQFSPSATIAEHAARQAAARNYAKVNGHDYLAAFEAFTAQADGGASLVESGGVHPTPSGYLFWANLMQSAIVSRSFV